MEPEFAEYATFSTQMLEWTRDLLLETAVLRDWWTTLPDGADRRGERRRRIDAIAAELATRDL